MNTLRKTIFKKISSSEFNKNVFTLVFGTSLAQLITFLLYPVISRLYTPSDFGVFGVFMSIAGMVALIATGRYELSIILPPSHKEGYNLLGLSFLINFGISCLALIVIVILNVYDVRFSVEYEAFNQMLYFVPLIIFLTSASNIFQNWFIRLKNFKLLSVSKILTSLGNNGVIVIMGFICAGVWGLFAGLLASLALVVVFFLFKFINIKKTITDLYFEKSKMKVLAHTYKDFPIANTWHALSDLFQSQGVIYFLAVFFTSATVGLYAFAMRILQAPMMLIVNSFSQVFYQKASELHNKKENLMGLLKSTVKKMSLIALPILLLLVVGGPYLFAFIFGENWREAGLYARILAPWICIDFIRYSIGQMPIVLNKLKNVLLWSITGNVLICLSLFMGGLFNMNIKLTFILLSAIMTIYSILLILWIFKITHHAYKG